MRPYQCACPCRKCACPCRKSPCRKSLPELQTTVTGMIVLAIAVGVGRFAFTPMLPIMQAEGLLSMVESGLLASVHFFGYWLGSVSAGWKPVWSKDGLRVSLLLIVLSTCAMGLTRWYPVWFVLRLASGVLSAWVFILVGHCYGNRLADKPQLQGWVLSGVGAGIAVTGLLAMVLMIGRVTSAGAWLSLGLMSAICVLPLYKRLAISVRLSPLPGKGGRSGGDWRLIVAYGVSGMGYIIPATFLPLMAKGEIADPRLFGWCWPVFGVAAMAATIGVSRVQHKYATRQVWAVSHWIMAIGILLPALYPAITTIALAGIAVGATFLTITLAALRASRELGGADAYRLLALLTTAFAIGQLAGPLLAALTYDFLGDFTPILITTSALLMVTAVSLVHPPRLSV